jgi:phosphatidylglycerophosphatase A
MNSTQPSQKPNKNIHPYKRFLATFIATAAGSGFTPMAPGTAGTVVGLIVVLYTYTLPFGLQCLLWLSVMAMGWWASLEWSKQTQATDSQQIVIDEVLGYWLSCLQIFLIFPIDSHPEWTTPRALLVMFVLFRFFDVAKPFPIRRLDRWGKNFLVGPTQSLMVIVDDLLAGVYSALIAAVALKFLFPSPDASDEITETVKRLMNL